MRVRPKRSREQVVRMAAIAAVRALERQGWWRDGTFTCAGRAFFRVDPRTGLPRGSIVQRTHAAGQGTGARDDAAQANA